MKTELSVVRRGYDPAEVQQLVGQLADELKLVAAESDQLRARIAELEQHTGSSVGAQGAPAEAATHADDVFAHWSRETNSLLDAARSSVDAVKSQATADAEAIRASAQAEADQILAEARHRADEMIAAAQLHSRNTMADADTQRAAIEAEVRAEFSASLAQAEQARAEVAALAQQRAALGKQLGAARSQLTDLLALIEPKPDGDA
jgi:cell division septum initiation protein DivIVA